MIKFTDVIFDTLTEEVKNKKLFQKLLPAKLRKQLLERVFNQLVDRSESSWVDEFYMTPDDLQRLVDNGMEVGSHAHSHEWLGEMSTDAQEDEITRSFELLSSINNSSEFKTISLRQKVFISRFW